MCRELLEVEENSKWALLILVELLQICKSMHSLTDVSEEVCTLCSKLRNIDAMHSEYYSYLSVQDH